MLISAREDAMKYMYPRGSPRPTNTQYTICMNRGGWGIRLGFTRSNKQSSGPVQAFNKRPRMKTDAEAQIRYVVSTHLS